MLMMVLDGDFVTDYCMLISFCELASGDDDDGWWLMDDVLCR